MPNERDGLAKGIPRITKTRRSIWPSVTQMISRNIQAARPVRPCEDDFESLEEWDAAGDQHIEDLMDWKIEQLFKEEGLSGGS